MEVAEADGAMKPQRQLRLLDVLEICAVAFMVVICTAYIVDSSFNPFLYFRF